MRSINIGSRSKKRAWPKVHLLKNLASASLTVTILVVTHITPESAFGEGRHGPLLIHKQVPSEGADQRVPTRLRNDANSLRKQGMKAARERFPYCNLVAPNSRLGISRRVGNRLVPARGAPNLRAEVLRGGKARDLQTGRLGRMSPYGIEGETAASSVPYQDTIRVLVLRIDFKTDRSGNLTTGNGKFNLSPPDTINVPVDPTPHDRDFYMAHNEALRRYYEVTTHGRLVYEYDVYPKQGTAYSTTDMADFGPWNILDDPDIFDKAFRMFRAFVVAADTQDVSIPWDQFHRVTLIHAGSDLQSDVNQNSPNDIPTFTIGVAEEDAIPVADSTIFIQAGMIMPETTNQDGFFAALNAVFAHEMGHLIFGWRDVYNVATGFPVCGLWTLMDTGNLLGTIVQTGQGANIRQFFAIGVLPPLTDPYQTSIVWGDVPLADPVQWGVVDSLMPPQVVPRVIRVPLSSEEYLLLENRRWDINGDDQLVLQRDPTTGVILGPSTTDSLEYDFLLPGEGVLAWHVDDSVVSFDFITGEPLGRRLDPFFSLNADPDRKGLQIFEADGLDDLGDFTSPLALGSPFDPFFIPNNGLLAPGGRPRLITNSGTDPHLQVEVLDSLQYSMRVRVTREWAVDGWPVVVLPAEGGVEPLVLNFLTGGRKVVFAAGDSAVHALRPDGLGGGVSGSLLWQSPASLSTIAELRHSSAGPVAVAVYPNPVTLSSGVGSMDGSRVIAVDGAGNAVPGFPVRIADSSPIGGRTVQWVTAGPIVVNPVAGGSRILVGTRSGAILSIREDGSVENVPFPVASTNPILSITAAEKNGAILVAAADSLGLVLVGGFGTPFTPTGTGASAPGWRPEVAWVEFNNGAGGQTQIGMEAGNNSDLPQLVVLDTKLGAGAIYQWEDPTRLRKLSELGGIDTTLAKGISVGDLDDDGFNEIVLATLDGRIGFWNLTGLSTPGWPGAFEPEHFATNSVPVVADVDGNPGLEIIAITGSGRLHALDRNKRDLPGWPLGTGAGQEASPALLDINGDGSLELLIADADSLLYAFDLPTLVAGSSPWPMWRGNSGRTSALVAPPSDGSIAQNRLIVDGSLKCYPNPAKRQPLQVAFSLREPASCTLEIFDASGRKVAEMSHQGLRSDNHITWDPRDQGPGLYVGRLQVRSATTAETHVVHMGVLH